MQSLTPFSILDHLETLNIVRESRSEIVADCPLCGTEGSLKIDPKNGKYKTFKCACMDTDEGKKSLIQAIAPMEKGHYRSPRPTAPKPKQAAKLPPIEGPVKLARFDVIPTDAPQATKPVTLPNGVPQGATVKTYRYSQTQFVKRFDWEDKTKPKGRDKTFRQCHVNDEGDLTWEKGNDPWPLYRESEAIAANGWILFQEGEECVETSRCFLGVPATTLQGSNWSEEAIKAHFTRLKEAGCHGILINPDNDKTGKGKGQTSLSVAAKIGLPALIVPMTYLHPECPEKGDIADWVKDGQAMGMTQDDFIKRLEAEIQAAVNRRSQESQESEPVVTSKTRYQALINELKLIQLETSPSYREFLLSELAEKTRQKQQFLKKLLDSLDDDVIKPQKTTYSLRELMAMEDDGQDWLIPGYLPRSELIILSAAPKVGKTLLVTQLMRAILTGGEFLGEKVKQGKVLYITSDETIQSVRRRLIGTGYFTGMPDEAWDNLVIVTKFDITSPHTLQPQLRELSPSIAVIDSLTSISRSVGISEKDPEFARNIYQLRDVLIMAACAGVLIHHDNKNKEARGIEKMSGSLRISAAAWGVWQLEKELDNPHTRKLTITPRETEPSAHRLEINPKPLWRESNIFRYVEEIGDESGQKKSDGDKILALLRNGDRLEPMEINQYIHSKNIYVVLGRLEDRGLISSGISKTTGKTVYFIPSISNSKELHPPENEVNPPLPDLNPHFPVSDPLSFTESESEATNTPTNTLLTVLLTTPTNTPISERGGEVLEISEPDSVPMETATEPAPIPVNNSTAINGQETTGAIAVETFQESEIAFETFHKSETVATGEQCETVETFQIGDRVTCDEKPEHYIFEIVGFRMGDTDWPRVRGDWYPEGETDFFHVSQLKKVGD